MPTLQIPESFGDWLEPHRWKVGWGGRGGGKSWAVADLLIAKSCNEKLRILCTREIQSSIDESVYRLLVDRIHAAGVADRFTIQSKRITNDIGSEFTFEGLRYNIHAIKSYHDVNVCWVEEADVVSEASWKILIPTIRSEGSEIWVTFNPRLDTDAAYQRFIVNQPPDCLITNVNWRDNPWFTDTMRQELEYLKDLDYDEYLHVWEGQLREYAEGAIYAQQLKKVRDEGRLCDLPIQPSCETHTAWDLGHDDATSIWWFQKVGAYTHFIDYYEANFEDIDHYAQVIQEKQRDHGLIYGKHLMPHDVEHKHLGMRDTRRRQFEEAGVKPIQVVPRVPHLQEGIDATKRVLASCKFDQVRCADGWKSLTNYRRKLNEVTMKYGDQPVHDWACHGADAFRQFAQGFRGGNAWNFPGDDEDMSDRRRKAIQRNRKRMNRSTVSHIV